MYRLATPAIRRTSVHFPDPCCVKVVTHCILAALISDWLFSWWVNLSVNGWMWTGKSEHKHGLLKRPYLTVTKSCKLEAKTAAVSSLRSTSIDCFEANKQLLQQPLITFTDICLQTTVSPLTPAGCYYICLANMIQACAVCVKIFALQLI